MTPPRSPVPGSSARRYEPAIDGLRAIAVSGVILYHADVAAFRGGYLGVDVFFVISGFLITRLLLAPGATESARTLGGFWLARARRLLPALLVVLLAAAAYAEYRANGLQLPRIRGDMFGGLTFVTNWVYVARGVSYFDNSGLTTSPLQHLWSLAVEEQFYLAWPLVVLAATASCRRRKADRARAVRNVAIVGVAASATTMFVLAVRGANAARLYYGTDVRIQAILAGCALAAHRAMAPPASERAARSNAAPIVAAVAAVVAAAVVLAAMMFVPADWSPLFRGGFLVVALASLLVVADITSRASWLQRVLAVRPLPYVGRLSYVLYLWHWPVVVAIDGQSTKLQGNALLAVRLGATIGLSVLTHYLVERPARRYRPSLRRRRVAPAFTAGITAVAVALVVVLATVTTRPAPARAGYSAPSRYRVYFAGDSSIFTLVYLGAPKSTSTLAIDAWIRIGCGIFLAERADGPTPADCSTWPADWAKEVATERPNVSVLSFGPWEVDNFKIGGKVVAPGAPAYDTLFTTQLDRARRILTARGGRVVLLDVPCFHESSGEALATFRNDPHRRAAITNVLEQFAAAHPGQVSVLHWSTLLCDGVAPRRDQGRLLRPDGIHFDENSASDVMRWVLEHVGAPKY